MKDRFEKMSIEQLYAAREVLTYLYPPMETACDLLDDLDEVLARKLTEYEQSDEYKAKKAETDALYASLVQP